MLFTTAAALQADGGAREGSALTAVIALHASGATFLAMAGYLGGEMVFRHHVATIEEEMEPQTNSQPGGAHPRGV